MKGALHVNAVGALIAVVLLSVGVGTPDRTILDAASQGDVETLRVLIQNGADVNAARGDGMTALHWAAERRDAEMAELLIEAGADLEAETRIGAYRPLHLASRAGSGAVVELLLEAGSDAGAKTSNSGTLPIHMAAAAGNPYAIRALVAFGSDVDAREGSWGQTPLVFAAANDRVEAIRTLLELGADPAVTTHVVDVPSRAAADQKANVRLQEVLDEFREEEGGDDDSWEPTPAQVEVAIRAARDVQRNADVEEVGEYEEEEVDEDAVPRYPDLVGTWGGLTPLLHATRQGHRDAAFALLEGGADINQVSAGDGTSPLLLATLNGHFDLAGLLLDRGADPNLPSDAGATPLYVAIEREWAPRASYAHPLNHYRQNTTYLDLMEKLLEAGADPNVRLEKHLWYMQYTFDVLRINTTGATPFWRAAFATDVAAMKLLVAYGADPHVATLRVPERRRGYGDDDDGDQSGVPPVPVGGPSVHPIHAASGVGYGEGFAANAHRHVPDGWLPAVKYLVEEVGADVNARDHNAYTALHHAASRGDNELVRYLVEQGADVTVVSRSGQTTADMANGPYQRIQPFPRTVALLEELGAQNNDNCVSC